MDGLKYQRQPAREAVGSPEWMTVKLRYKAPQGTESTKIEVPVKGDPGDWTEATEDFQFAAGVALFGEKLRVSDKIAGASWELVKDLAGRGSKQDLHGYRAEFRELVDLAARRFPEREPVPEPTPQPVPVPEPLPVPPGLESGSVEVPKVD